MFPLHTGLGSLDVIAVGLFWGLHNYFTLQQCIKGCPHRGGQMGKVVRMWCDDFPIGGLLSYQRERHWDVVIVVVFSLVVRETRPLS